MFKELSVEFHEGAATVCVIVLRRGVNQPSFEMQINLDQAFTLVEFLLQSSQGQSSTVQGRRPLLFNRRALTLNCSRLDTMFAKLYNAEMVLVERLKTGT